MKINQQMSEFQLAQAQKEIVEDVLRVKHVVNTSRNAINNFNKKLGKELHVKTTDNPTLTNLIKYTAKMKKANVHYEPNTSLWYKIDGDTLYIRGHEAEGYSERVLYTNPTLAKNGWRGNTKITKVIIEEIITPTSCVRLFDGCTNIVTIEGVNKIVMDNCTDMSTMFQDCHVLENVDLSEWNVSNVKKMFYTFNKCYALYSVGNISNWDTSNVTDMTYLFCNCYELQRIGHLNKWNVSNVTSMKAMFASCEKLDEVGNLSNWNVSNVTTMYGMFHNCHALRSVGDLNKWNVSNVTSMRQMFQACYDITQIGNIGNWNVTNVTDMEYMFVNSISVDLDTLGDLSNWNTSNLKNVHNFIGGSADPSSTYFKHYDNFKMFPIPPNCNTIGIFDKKIGLRGVIKCGKISSSIMFKDSPLTHNSALVLINALDAENPGTLTLSTETYATLTDEDKAIATSKGWTIAA